MLTDEMRLMMSCEMQFEQVPLWFLQVMKVNVHLHLRIA
jgi:hypothetical protein